MRAWMALMVVVVGCDAPGQTEDSDGAVLTWPSTSEPDVSGSEPSAAGVVLYENDEPITGTVRFAPSLQAAKIVAIINDGSEPLELMGVHWYDAPPGVSVATQTLLPYVLEPGAAFIVIITRAPSLDATEWELLIETEKDHTSITIGIDPTLPIPAADPPELTLSDAATSMPQTATLKLCSNVSAAAPVVTGLALETPSDELSIVSAPAMPFALACDEVSVRYAPSDDQPDDNALLVTTDEGTMRVPIAGRPILDGAVTWTVEDQMPIRVVQITSTGAGRVRVDQPVIDPPTTDYVVQGIDTDVHEITQWPYWLEPGDHMAVGIFIQSTRPVATVTIPMLSPEPDAIVIQLP